MKRALRGSTAINIAGMSQDLAIAVQYGAFKDNEALFFKEQSDWEKAEWEETLARAIELGLDQDNETDDYRRSEDGISTDIKVKRNRFVSTINYGGEGPVTTQVLKDEYVTQQANRLLNIGGKDILVIDTGIFSDEVTFSVLGKNLYFTVQNPVKPDGAPAGNYAETFQIVRWTTDWNQVDTIRFASGQEFDVTDIGIINGTTVTKTATTTDAFSDGPAPVYYEDTNGVGQGDLFEGTDGNDVIWGVKGDDDTLMGGGGDDTYRFERGAGNDVAFDVNWQQDKVVRNVQYWYGRGNGLEDEFFSMGHNYTELNLEDGGSDVVEFGIGIRAEDLSFEFSGNDLVVTVVDPANPGSKDTLTIRDWGENKHRIESFTFAEAGEAALGVDDVLDKLFGDKTTNSVFAIDLERDGLDLVSRDDSGVLFDMDGDGFREQTGWVKATDGLLVMDHNQDGVINDITEMYSAFYDRAGYQGLAGNLADLDSNKDGVFNKDDDDFDKARIWVDTNQDGVTDLGEIKAFHRFGILEIDLTEAFGSRTLEGSEVVTYGLLDQVGVTTEAVGAAYGVYFDYEHGVRLDETILGTGEWSRFNFEDKDNVLFLNGNYDVNGTSFEATAEVGSFVTAGMGDDTLSVAAGESADNGFMLNGGAGDDSLTGGDGNDTLIGAEGSDTLIGGAGNDLLTIDHDDLVSGHVDGGAGEDLIVFEGEEDLNIDVTTHNSEAFVGGKGNDTLSTSGSGDVALSGGEGDDSLTGGTGNDQLLGEAGDDVLTGGLGDDVLQGGEGNDTLNGGDGNDILYMDEDDQQANIDGGAGTDTVIIEGTDDVAFDAGAANVEIVIGGYGDDTLSTSGSGAVELYGGAGDDTLAGGAGADTLDGSSGKDTASYAAAAAAVTVDLGSANASGVVTAEGDTLVSIENVIGSAFNDTLTGDDGANVLEGGAGADVLSGGDGSDTASYTGSGSADGTTGVQVDLSAGIASGNDAAGDSLTSIENLIGSDFNDSLTGDDQDNGLAGGGGDDTLKGLAGDDGLFGEDGDDLLYGGDGNDLLEGGAGADSLYGDAGTDALVYSSSEEAVSVDLATGTVSGGDAAGDVIDGFENLVGSAHDDTLAGDSGANVIAGGAGDDEIVATSGADTIEGGLGQDTVDYTAAAAAVTADLEDGTASVAGGDTDTLISVENLKGSAFADTITGNDDGNIIEGGAGADSLDGGDGTDTVSYESSNAGVTVNLLDETVSGGDAAGDAIEGFENAIGSGHGDSLIGSDDNNEFLGEAGSDTIHGNGGSDGIVGGEGSDLLYGDAGNDLLVGGTGADTLYAGEDDDTLLGDEGNDKLFGDEGNDLFIDGEGSDTIDGGDGIDTIDYSGGDSVNGGIVVDMVAETVTNTAGTITTDKITLIENIVATDQADTLIGDEGDNIFSAGKGNDSLDGADGDDQLSAGDGDNTLIGGAGDDKLYAEDGVDILDAGDGDDELYAGGGADSLVGGDGDDVLSGGDGNDTLKGGAGNDQMTGGAGDDLLYGSIGVDYYSLGKETGADIINDYARYSYTEEETRYRDVEVAAGESYDYSTTTGGEFSVTKYWVRDVPYTVSIPKTATIEDGYDVIQIGDGLTIDDLAFEFTEGGDTLVIAVRDPLNPSATASSLENRVVIENWNHADYRIEGMRFSDGTEINIKDITSILEGDETDNNLTGTSASDLMFGFDGADTLDGGAGADVMSGGDGHDYYKVDHIDDLVHEFQDAGSDTLEASVSLQMEDDSHIETVLLQNGAGDLSLTGGALDEHLVGNDGDNVIVGGKGADTLDGGAGRDEISYSTSDAGVSVNLGTSAVSGGDAEGDQISNFEDVRGSEHHDILMGDGTANELKGGKGNDTLIGGGGADTLVGGDGEDLVDYASSSAGVSVDLTLGLSTGGDAAGDKLISIEKISGSFHDDTLIGDVEDNWLEGVTGADSLSGAGGADTLVGGIGADSLDGGAGNDVLLGEDGNDSLAGGAGADTLLGGDGQDTLLGGDGNDLMNSGSGDDLLYGGTGTDTYYLASGIGVDTVIDGSTQQTQTTEARTRQVWVSGSGGEGGSSGGEGGSSGYWRTETYYVQVTTTTTVNGGQDIISVADGLTLDDISMELINGGDTLVLAIKDPQNPDLPASQQTDKLVIENWNETAYKIETLQFADGTQFNLNNITVGTIGNEALNGTAASNSVFGSAGNDTVDGLGGDDYLNGGIGADSLVGADGNDTLVGGSGADTLIGGAGNDLMYGGAGDDLLYGDEGVDHYFLGNGTGIDTIFDNARYEYQVAETRYRTVQVSAGESYDYTTTTGGEFPITYYWKRNVPYTVNVTKTAVVEEGYDVIHIGEGLTLSDLTFEVTNGGSTFVLAIKDPQNPSLTASQLSDQLIVENWDNTDFQIEGLRFADGSEYTVTSLISGEAFSSNLVGTDDADEILGTVGSDTLTGGLGADTLDGAGGSDTAEYSASDAAVNVSLKEATASGGHAAGDVLKRIENLVGSDYADTLEGNNKSNILIGGVGADSLAGGSGDDVYVFRLGDGADNIIDHGIENVAFKEKRTRWVSGGEGYPAVRETYYVNVYTEMTVDGGDDVIQFGPGVSFDDLAFERVGDDLIIGLRESANPTFNASQLSDRITIGDWAISLHKIETLRFDDGQEFDLPDPDGWMLGTETADSMVATAQSDYILAGNGDDTIDGDDGNDTIYGGAGDDLITGGNGINIIYAEGGSDTAVFSGNMADYTFKIRGEVITVVGTDGASELHGIEQIQFADQTVPVMTNTAPTVTGTVAEHWAVKDTAFVMLLPEGLFAETDNYDYLTLTATLVNGDPLPSWLRFTGTGFVGTPDTADIGTPLSVKVMAVDVNGASVDTSFTLNVLESNAAPEVANEIDDQTALEDTSFTFTIPVGTFTDADTGAVLTYSASLAGGGALPAWLTFDAATRTFSGTPAEGDLGTISVQVTASDITRASVTETFQLTATDNLPPVSDGAAVKAAVDQIINGQLSATDADTPVVNLTYSLGTAAVNGTAIVNADGSYTYTPNAGYSGADSFTYQVADGAGGTTTATVNVTLYDPGSAYTETQLLEEAATNYGSGAVNLGRDPGFFNLDDFTISATFELNDLTINGQAILWNHTLYMIEVKHDDLWIRLNTTTGEKSIYLHDAFSATGWHDLQIVRDSNTDQIDVWLDGSNIHSEVVPDIDIGGPIWWDVRTGEAWGRNLDGRVADITVLKQVVAIDGTQSIYQRMVALDALDTLVELDPTASGVLGQDLDGTTGTDLLIGAGAADTLTGGTGDDTLLGGAGDDTYTFARGDAADVISDSAGSDTLSLGATIEHDQLWFEQSGDDLLISVIGSSDEITVQNWYQSSDNKIEEIEAGDGKTLDISGVEALVTAMATFSAPGGGETDLSGSSYNDLQDDLTANWQSS